MKLSIDIVQDDFKEFYRHAIKTMRSRGESDSDDNSFVLFFGLALLGVILGAALKYLGFALETSYPFIIAFIAFFAIVYFVSVKKHQKHSIPREGGVVLGKQDLEISDLGISCKAEHHSIFTSWDIVISLEETKNCFLIYIDTLMAHIIPKRNFDSPEKRGEFIKLVKGHMKIANKRMQTDL